MCAVAHLQCSATLIFATYSNPLLGTAVQDRLTAGLCCCRNITKTCSKCMCAVAHLQCSATLIFATYSSPLLGTAVQDRLTAGLCCCKNSYGDLLQLHVCSGPPSVECHADLSKIQLPPVQHCCAIQADSRLVLLQRYQGRLALTTCVQWPSFSAVPH